MNCTTIEISKFPYLAMEILRLGGLGRAQVVHLGLRLGPLKLRFRVAGVRPTYLLRGRLATGPHRRPTKRYFIFPYILIRDLVGLLISRMGGY